LHFAAAQAEPRPNSAPELFEIPTLDYMPLASPSIPAHRNGDGCEPPNRDPARNHH
jgi:hypothetical protein